MTKLFGRDSRTSHTEASVKESGLSDKTNFPLLSSKWVRGPEERENASNFSARRLLCFVDPRRGLAQTTSPQEYVKPHPKATSPPQDVANAWVSMASETMAFDAVGPSWSRSSRRNSSSRVHLDRDTTQSLRASRAMTASVTSSSSSSTTSISSSPSAANRYQRRSRYASHNTSRSNTSMRRTKNPVKESANQTEWRSAVDPKSGRTYYYNIRTRETQWRKPMELATPEEQKEMQKKERKQKDFFAAMEANILKQMSAGVVPGTPRVTPDATMTQDKNEPTRQKTPTLEKPRMVRTISGMDDQILKQLVKRVPSLRNADMKLSRDNSFGMPDLSRLHDEGHISQINEESMSSSMDMSAMEISLADLKYDMDVESPSAREENHALMQLAKTAEEMAMVSGSAKGSPTAPIKEKTLPSGGLKRPSLIDSRRNTCGTMYVGSTMSAPDKDATIKCVCGVYRAHILSSAKEEQRASFYFDSSDSKYRIFNDREQDRHRAGTVQEDAVMEDFFEKDIPSLDEITNFYRNVFRRAQMESDCIIMSLIYVERLIKNTDGELRPRPSNWRSLLFSCMILSSKVWDDLSMWNADFSQTCPAGVRFSLQRINELELAVLNALDYKVKVPASEYAKYYFLLRSMLIKSGLGGDDIKSMTPLDVEGAKKLEQVSSSFQSMAATKRRVAHQNQMRSKSMGDVDASNKMDGTHKIQEKKASLEHMVKM